MLWGKDYSKETQILVRKPHKQCGKCLELLLSLIRFPSSVFPARPRTLKSQSPSLCLFPHFARSQLRGSSFLSGSTRQQLSPFHQWERRNFIPRLMANYIDYLFKPPSLRKTKFPQAGPSPQVSASSPQLIFCVTNMDIGLSAWSTQMANYSVDAQASLGLRSGHREKPALPTGELDIMLRICTMER